MEIYERNIAAEWYQHGLKANDDFFMRFMMHWMGFNWLYNHIKAGSERAKIKEFYRQNECIFDKVDPFTFPEINVFLAGAVTDEITGAQRRKDFQNLKCGKVEGLLMTLYQVRCNLFHGAKSLRNDRDIELVKASAKILEEYMRVIVSHQ